jgi:PAS domain S-box-containing protein
MGLSLRETARIYHTPTPIWSGRKKITQHEVPSKKTLGMHMVSGESGIYRYAQENQKMVAFYQPVPITGWSVASVLPEKELFAPAIQMMRLLTIITLFFVILIGIAILLAIQRLIKPLQVLTERTQEIASGHLEGGDLDVGSQDEIGSLSRSFNIMTGNLKKSLSVLKKSEDNYRGIFENSLVGILQVSIKGRVINANPAMARILGYDSAQTLIHLDQEIGRELYVNPEDRQRIFTLLGETGSIQNQEVQFYRVDHAIIWVSIAASLIRDDQGEPLQVEALVIDISDRKAADEDLRHLRNYLSSIINSMPSVLTGVDKKGRVTQWNTKAEQVTGLSMEQAQFKPLGNVLPHLADEIDRIYAAIRNRRMLTILKIPHTIKMKSVTKTLRFSRWWAKTWKVP